MIYARTEGAFYRVRRSRKDRTCEGCHRPIVPPTPYVVSTLPPGSDLGNSTFWRLDLCEACMPLPGRAIWDHGRGVVHVLFGRDREGLYPVPACGIDLIDPANPLNLWCTRNDRRSCSPCRSQPVERWCPECRPGEID